MDIKEYQQEAAKTAQFPGALYPLLGLVGEIGEVGEYLKKSIRDGLDDKARLTGELGDVLWYISAIATVGGFDLQESLSAPDSESLDSEVRTFDDMATQDSDASASEAFFQLLASANAMVQWSTRGNGIAFGSYQSDDDSIQAGISISGSRLTWLIWDWVDLVLALGLNPSEVARANIDKLKSRAERGVIKGDGDNR